MDERDNPRLEESTRTMAQKVQFTMQQIEYMEKMYPEVTGSATTTEAEYRFRAGQRSIIHYMRANAQHTKGNADGLVQ